jgi:ESS family glutamate:Na+ symporter
MELVDGTLAVGPYFAVTLGIIVLFLGRRLNLAFAFLRNFSIPEAVSGGLVMSVLLALVYVLTDVAVAFNLGARDLLLVYFFTTIGINARLSELLLGGKPLVILLAVTVGFLFAQNLMGISVAALLGLPSAVGVLGGSVSLIGGHGTAIAWAPRIAEEHGIANAMEIGVATATFGLILASLMGGPIGKFLIERHKLQSTDEHQDVGTDDTDPRATITHLDFLDSLLAIHLSAILGLVLNDLIGDAGLRLPLFVTCLFAGIFLTNVMPREKQRLLTGTRWPSRTPAMALIAEVSLGTFLAMSLMSMQLWTLVDLAGPLFAIVGAQFVLAVAINIFIVFPLMGRTYDAAVISAGFGGISLGSTPTAMANMAAVTQRYGPSHLAFIVVPLVCAFFIDLVNALAIPFFLGLGR